MANHKEEYDQFVDRMAKIRYLSSPALYDMDDAQDYAKRLRKNFQAIGQLAEENRKMLDDILYPILESDQLLDENTVSEMSEFEEKLLTLASDTTDFENLDVPIMALVAKRLCSDAAHKSDVSNRIIQMDAVLISCYSLMNQTERIESDPHISEAFRKRGLAAGEFFLEMAKKENFLSIPDLELRDLVLTNARFVSAFYENAKDEASKKRNLDILDWMMRISGDPFYHRAVPDFDWKYFQFRVLGYYLQCTDNANLRGFQGDQLERIALAAEALEKLMASDEDYFAEVLGDEGAKIFIKRNYYLTGRISKSDYWKFLLDEYEIRDKEDFSSGSNYLNVLVPLELIALMSKRKTANECRLMKTLYQNMNAYMFGMPNAGSLSFVMEYFTGFLNRFCEKPSVMSFEDFGLQTLAALHPPTYIHSLMVGQITECLCSFMIEKMPERLVGVCGTKSTEEVLQRSEEILYFAYHAAVCHDFGKIMIIDTIFVYGRRLLEFEFQVIKSHPMMGADLLSRHESTRRYVDVAKGHHRFWDDSRGYPEKFITAKSPDKPIIDLVMCADCMDAATDSIGRSYNSGKTLKEYLDEVREQAGSRYAPWLPQLIDDLGVQDELRFLLSEGRAANYRETFLLLKNVREKGR